MGEGTGDEPSPNEAPAVEVGLVQDLWRTKCWRLFPLLTSYVVCLTFLMPLKPALMTDFFASRHSRHYIHCEDYVFPQKEPQACQDAHSTVVAYSSVSDFISNSFLLFLLAPMVGRWSDAYGRQPFLVMTFVCASFPVMVLFLNLHFGISMFFYFPAQAVNGALSSISICMAYTADKLQPRHRAPTFGFILASFSVGILVGPLGGGYVTPPTAAIVALAGLVGCILYVLLLIPESTTKESRLKTRMQARELQKAEPATMLRKPWQGFSILTRSKISMQLTATMMLSSIVYEGLYELLMQYFQIKLNFNTKDQSHMYVLAGLCGMFTQLVLLRLLLIYLGKRNMLLVGLMASFAQQMLLVFAWSKASALVAMCIGSIGNLAFPAISSIKSLNVLESEQGAVQGALQGARALAQGLGPLVFAGLFSLFTQSWSPLPFIPGAPFGFGALLILVAFTVACTIDRERAEKGLQQPPSDPLAEALLLHHGNPQGAQTHQDIHPKTVISHPSDPLASPFSATTPQDTCRKQVTSHPSDPLANPPDAPNNQNTNPTIGTLCPSGPSTEALLLQYGNPPGFDEEAPADVGRRPSIHYPKNYVLQHSEGPAILLDMTPEIAAEIMAPEVAAPISLPASRTASRTLSSTPPSQAGDSLPSSSNSQEEEAAALLPQSTSAGTQNL